MGFWGRGGVEGGTKGFWPDVLIGEFQEGPGWAGVG